MNFNQLLDTYRDIAFSEHDKGDRFEWLMQTTRFAQRLVSRSGQLKIYFESAPQHHQRNCADSGYC
jgi:hypothetical protein